MSTKSLFVLNNHNKNMHSAEMLDKDGVLAIAMDDHDAYHGWSFTEQAENELLAILYDRKLSRDPDWGQGGG